MIAIGGDASSVRFVLWERTGKVEDLQLFVGGRQWFVLRLSQPRDVPRTRVVR